MRTIRAVSNASINPSTGAAYGKLTTTTPITVPVPGAANFFHLAVDSTSGVTGTVTVTYKVPGITAAQIGDGNVLTVEQNRPLSSGALPLDCSDIVLTPNVTAQASWRLAFFGDQ